MRKLTSCLAFAALFGACSSLAPVPVRVGDVCYRCRRTIVDTTLAAETIGAGGLALTFRTSGCLATYLAEHASESGAQFVTDSASGKLVPAGSAVFVPTFNRDTGERDYLAFKKGPAADQAALERHVALVTWMSVLEASRKTVARN